MLRRSQQPDVLLPAKSQETDDEEKDVEENIHEMGRALGWDSVNNPLAPVHITSL